MMNEIIKHKEGVPGIAVGVVGAITFNHKNKKRHTTYHTYYHTYKNRQKEILL